MDQTQLNWIVNFIWGIADDVLRDLSMNRHEFDSYYVGTETAIAIYVDSPVRFREPIPLDSMGPYAGAIRPPQSYRYLKREDLARSPSLNES